MDIYKDIILDHYKNPRNWGRLKNPSRTSIVNNPFCGDRFEFDIKFDKEKIKDIKFRGYGCVISVASASMLSVFIKNKTKDNLKKLDKNFIIKMLGISLGPTRLKCALLPLAALKKII